MEKLIYLFGDAAAGSIPSGRSDLRDAVFGLLPELQSAGAQRLTLSVADLSEAETAPVDQFNPLGLIDGMLSFWLDSLDTRAEIEQRLAPLSARHALYLVTESVPREYEERSWKDGERSPGIALVTTFPKPDHVDDEAFFAGWHDSHTPLSLEIHPLIRYVRNSVARVLTPDAPAYRAIVSESVTSVEVAADPEQFYGGEANRKRAVRDLLAFTDFEGLSTVLMSEYILSS